MTVTDGFVAASRFGLGAAPGELNKIGNDPRGWLVAQLKPQPLPELLAQLPGTPALYERYRDIQAERKAAKQQVSAETPSAPGASPGVQAPAKLPAMGEPIRQIYIADLTARTHWAARTPAPLVERLVHFWSNHFTVSITRPQVLAIAGSYEREAIRPHVLGRFRDMLQAVATHPAMLLYLDNAQSIGPNSLAGKRRDKGLNENLAREMLELHTLGVNGGYSQADVTEFARVLTGWTLMRPMSAKRLIAMNPAMGEGPVGQFTFDPRLHEPGDKHLLGATIRERGFEEGEQVLDLLAHHPATARFVATKLVRHFVADDPPKAAVEAVAAAFHDSQGDLTVTTRALIARPEAWDPPLTKVRTPNELVIATLRALGDPPLDEKAVIRSLNLLGQPTWAAPSPAGWPDTAQAWLGPEALMQRLEWASLAASRIGKIDAVQLADATIGPAMRPETRAAIAGAATPREATMMWLAAREFQRR